MTADSANPMRLQNAQRVRAAGLSAAIGAAFLLYFGFLRLVEPEATDLFSLSNLIFYYAARFGGFALAAIALWLWTGHNMALLADGIVATVIGVVLVVTGLGMAVDGGGMFELLFNFFCGYMFYSSGVQNGKEYFRMTKRLAACDLVEEHVYVVPDRDTQVVSAAPFIEEVAPNSEEQSVSDPAAERESQTIDTPNPSPPPVGGYLASFAKKNPTDDS